MQIDFGSGVIKIFTKGLSSGDPFYKFYYGAIRGAVYPSNYDAELDLFLGITFSINGDIHEVPDASQLMVNSSYPGGALECMNALVINFNIYTYTNPAY
jgi:hypothetical protein